MLWEPQQSWDVGSMFEALEPRHLLSSAPIVEDQPEAITAAHVPAVGQPLATPQDVKRAQQQLGYVWLGVAAQNVSGGQIIKDLVRFSISVAGGFPVSPVFSSATTALARKKGQVTIFITFAPDPIFQTVAYAPFETVRARLNLSAQKPTFSVTQKKQGDTFKMDGTLVNKKTITGHITIKGPGRSLVEQYKVKRTTEPVV